tara:strand:+ start:1009 stop:1584 length:576 start_codon:yes stop_codon:yes gene_type:complete
MFIYKKKYFLIIENINDINLSNIKRYNKFLIIYRNNKKNENIQDLFNFRRKCRLKLINFFVANDLKMAIKLNADGIYLSSNNREFKPLNIRKNNFDIIGSAHNSKEIYLKKKQNCRYILLSKLFTVDYDKEASTLGLIKFNKYAQNFRNQLVPLGGIKLTNLNALKNIKSEGFAILSELKKKPVKIINRLF